MRTILVAIELSGGDGDGPCNALTAAARFAVEPGSEVHVVTVLDPREVAERDDAIDEAKAIVAHALRAHGFRGDVVVHIEDGVAWRAIVALAARVRADMIVVGKRDRSLLHRIILGSVAEQVVKHARCPVFVARKTAYAEASQRGSDGLIAFSSSP